MPRHGKYPPKLKERAIRMVREHRDEYGSDWEAITSVANRLGPTPEIVRKRVRQDMIDRGKRGGPTTAEGERIRVLEREVKELRRANETAVSAALSTAPTIQAGRNCPRTI